MNSMYIHGGLRLSLVIYGCLQVFPASPVNNACNIASANIVKARQISQGPRRTKGSDLDYLLWCEIGRVAAPQILLVSDGFEVIRVDAWWISAQMVDIHLISHLALKPLVKDSGNCGDSTAMSGYGIPSRIYPATPKPTSSLFVDSIKRLGNLLCVMDDHSTSTPTWPHSHSPEAYHEGSL